MRYSGIPTQLILSLLLCCLSTAREVDFAEYFTREPPPEGPIPKVAHFVWSKLKPLGWLEYAAIRSAVDNLGAETINLWVPEDPEFEGPIWQLVLALPNIVVREEEMPTKIYGNEVTKPAHVSDILRLEVLYTEGGIYMDYNLVALRSSDEVIDNPNTESTVLALQDANVFCNAIIMAKKHAPFLRIWMSTYENFNDSDWAGLSLVMPKKLYDAGAPGLTVLPTHSWYYPVCCTEASDIKLWLGKSFYDIDENYGVHQWGGRFRSSSMMTPEAVREIDTPFFCRIRHLFNGVGGSYVAEDYRFNPNCSLVMMNALASRSPESPMAIYTFEQDTRRKVIDSSGNHLHGWAPYETGLLSDNGDMVREFRQDTFVVLPLPLDYDGRHGMVEMEILFQQGRSDRAVIFMPFQLRLADNSRIRWHFAFNSNTGTSITYIEALVPDRPAETVLAQSDNLNMSIFDDQYHHMTFSWDQADQGLVNVRIDHINVLTAKVPTLNLPIYGEDMWLNGYGLTRPDANLRARIKYMKVYSMPKFGQVTGSMAPLSKIYAFASPRMSASWLTFSVFAVVLTLGSRMFDRWFRISRRLRALMASFQLDRRRVGSGRK